MKIIVGLGNPGKEYIKTRHNMGFYMIDNYLGNNISWKNKFNGLYYETVISGEKIIFLKPLSYMNLSGEVIKKFVDFYKIAIGDILIISDDLDLNVGSYRLKASGSSGGHNGLKSIEHCLATRDYKRLKIGISNNKKLDTKDYVLGKLSDEEQNIFKDISAIVNNIINDFVNMDFSSLMNKYNHKSR